MACLKGALLSDNTAARLSFAKLHLSKQQGFWISVRWTDKNKVEVFSHNTQNHVWKK